MIPATSDTNRPHGHPVLPDDLVDSVARRSNLDTGQTRDMLDGFFSALDALETADLLADVDAPIPFTIVPGVIA